MPPEGDIYTDMVSACCSFASLCVVSSRACLGGFRSPSWDYIWYDESWALWCDTIYMWFEIWWRRLVVPLYFLKSNGQLGGRVILGRSLKGSMLRALFGSARFLIVLFNCSISVWANGSTFGWRGLRGWTIWGAKFWAAGRVCNDWTASAKDAICADSIWRVSALGFSWIG